MGEVQVSDTHTHAYQHIYTLNKSHESNSVILDWNNYNNSSLCIRKEQREQNEETSHTELNKIITNHISKNIY